MSSNSIWKNCNKIISYLATTVKLSATAEVDVRNLASNNCHMEQYPKTFNCTNIRQRLQPLTLNNQCDKCDSYFNNSYHKNFLNSLEKCGYSVNRN